jgi:transcriptional regulator with XRE-family HTH domain
MSPHTFRTPSSDTVSSALSRLWVDLGIALREARLARTWTVRELARRADVSAVLVYRVEAGQSSSTEAAARLASSLGLRLDFELTDPRRSSKPSLSADAVHSAMGELETAHLRGLGMPTGVDEPYQHFQFAGRADVVAWDVASAALLHIENRTRFPDFQEMAGAYNSKRAYLASSLGERLGIRHWASQTHVIAALWSSEVLHALRLRRESFRSLCPDPLAAFEHWWAGTPPSAGQSSILVVLDPLAAGRQRLFVALDEALAGARPRHRDYADVAARLLARG